MFHSRAGRSILMAVVLTAAVALAPSAFAEEATATVTVVHGVPGLTVDVYVNGANALPAFAPGTVTDPLPFAPGAYDLVIVAAGGDPAMPVLSASATLAAGDDVSIVAHLKADGSPTLSLFANDLSRAGSREGRVVVRHTASAPAVDVKLSRKVWRRSYAVGLLPDLTNGSEASADVRARSYYAEILPAGTNDPVLPAARVRVRPQQATIVYAVGSLADGTLQLLVQTVELTGTKAQVSVVHGVPGLTVDVYVNGDLLLGAFAPGTITDVLDLTPGTYDIAIVPQGGDPAMPAIAGSFPLVAGRNVSLVAHLNAAGTPVLSAFANDVSRAGFASRIAVRHAAAAPAVDAYLRWTIWGFSVVRRLAGIESGEQRARLALPGHYAASVTLAGMPAATVLGPAPLNVGGSTLYAIYAVGSAEAGTLQILVQTLPLR